MLKSPSYLALKNSAGNITNDVGNIRFNLTYTYNIPRIYYCFILKNYTSFIQLYIDRA